MKIHGNFFSRSFCSDATLVSIHKVAHCTVAVLNMMIQPIAPQKMISMDLNMVEIMARHMITMALAAQSDVVVLVNIQRIILNSIKTLKRYE